MSIAAAVVCVLIAVAGIWLSRSLPGIVAAEVGRLTNTRVEAGSVTFHLNGSISIDGLVIRPAHDETGYDNTILRAKTVYVHLSRRSLLSLSPRVTDLHIEDFVLDVQMDLDTERWNVGTLRFNRSGGRTGRGAIPAVELQSGRLRYREVSGGKGEIVMSVPVEARFGTDLGHQGYGFEIKTSRLSGGYGESYLSGSWRPGELTVAGGLSSTDMPSLERAWAVDVLAGQFTYERNSDYRLALRMKDLHGKQAPEVGVLQVIAPAEVRESGALAGLRRFLARYRPTGTVQSISVNAIGNLRRLRESEVIGKLVCEDVSVCDTKFPYAIDHLAGELEFTQSGVLMRQLSGRHGDVDVRIEGWTKGFGAERQYRYKVSSGNMILDEALYAALQPGQKRLWDAFRPSGRVAADYWLARTSPTDKRMYVSVELDGVSASFHEFPYPLTGLTGKLYFDRESITATNLVSESGARRIRLDAKVSGMGTGKPIHYISIDANNIPLDATLEKSLPAQHRELYGQLEADGTADVRARVFSTGDANNVGPMSYFADVVCRSTSLKLEQSPVVLSDVVAEVAVSPNSLTIRKLDGRYEQSRVALTGGMRLGGDAKARQYHADMTVEDVPFNETTIRLLPASLAERIAAFRPQGNVNLHMEIQSPDGPDAQRPSGSGPPVYTGSMECLGVKINHQRIPYPLHDIRGTISLTRDRLELKDVTAAPVDPCQPKDSAVIHINGFATLAKGDLAGGSFTLQTQGMLFTKGLGDALPQGLAGAYRDLSPYGPFDLDVPTLTISRIADNEMLVEFAGTADIKACDLRISGAEMNLTGGVEVGGSYGAKGGLLSGRVGLTAERLAIKGKTITHVTAEAIYDPNARRWSADNLLGDCYRGRVLGSLQLGRAEAGGIEYILRAALNRVDLLQFLQAGSPPVAGEKPYSGGVMNASLTLGGRTGDVASRRGVCQVDIKDMRVGKVSPLANLLSVLSLNEPTDYTFERMQIDSYIKRSLLLIRKLDMAGKNVAFTGSGTMALPGGELDLILTARGPRLAAAEPSVLQALTEGLGGAVIRVEVTGKTSDPQVETKALPVIEDSLRILGTPE